MGTLATIGIFVGSIFATMLAGELLMRVFGVPLEIGRKTFHLLAGSVCIIMPYVAADRVPLAIVSGVFLVSLPIMIELSIFKIQERKRGYGTVAFAAGYLIVTWCFFDRKEILTSALVVLTYGDALAAIVGHSLGKRRYAVGRSHKTLEGSFTFLVVSFVGVALVLWLHGTGDLATIFWVALALALLSAVVEAVSVGDIDNGVIPVFAAVMLLLLLDMDARGHVHFSLGIAMAGALAVLSYARRWVTLQGGLVVFLIFAVNYGVGGWMWVLPPLFLLASSSLLSKVTGRAFVNPFVANRGPRGLTQIAAKGIPSMLLALAWAVGGGFAPLYLVCLAVLATASADTFSSSIGGLSRRDPIASLPTLELVPKGMSGGVTLLGSASGMLGAALMALFVLPFAEGGWVTCAWVVLCGIAGNTADTLTGSTVQALYVCSACGAKTEALVHCDRGTTLNRGLGWVNNETVNLVSGLVGGAAASGLIWLGLM